MSAAPPGREEGAGAILALAITAGVVTIALAVLAVAAAFTVRQRVIGAADAAAVTAADAARGLIPGDPCERAALVTAHNGALLVECHIDQEVATVVARAAWVGVNVDASARAGPPRDDRSAGD